MTMDEAIAACKEVTEELLESQMSVQELAATLTACSGIFLGGAAGAMATIARSEGKDFTQEEMVRATANALCDITYGNKQ